jgi:uncharacterized membrane protein (Fun14 family)
VRLNKYFVRRKKVKRLVFTTLLVWLSSASALFFQQFLRLVVINSRLRLPLVNFQSFFNNFGFVVLALIEFAAAFVADAFNLGL